MTAAPSLHKGTCTLRHFAEYCEAFGILRGGSNLVRAKWPGSGLVRLGIGPNRSGVQARSSSPDISKFEQVFVGREYEFDYGETEPTWIIDGGAKVGYSSVYYARRFPNAIIAAVEPDAGNFEILLLNVSKFKNIRPLHAALRGEAAPLRISDTSPSRRAPRAETASSSAERRAVKELSVPQVMQRIGADRIDILKLDIEGAEYELFRSRPSWLARTRYIAIELHDDLCGGSSAAFYRALSAYGFTQSSRGDNVLVRVGVQMSSPGMLNAG